MLEKGKRDRRAAARGGRSRHRLSATAASSVVGTDRRMSLFEVAARAAEMKKRGAIAEDLDTKTTTETPQTFPNGCHIAEVEIDPDTGRMRDRRLHGGRRLRQRARSR